MLLWVNGLMACGLMGSRVGRLVGSRASGLVSLWAHSPVGWWARGLMGLWWEIWDKFKAFQPQDDSALWLLSHRLPLPHGWESK